MKIYEIESLLKSFLIFFFMQEILLSTIMWYQYQSGVNSIDMRIKSQMKICSFNLKCERFELDFVPVGTEEKIRHFYKNGDVYIYFIVPTVDNYLMKILLPREKYQAILKELKSEVIKSALVYSLLIAFLSLLLSFYALYPLKKALKLNEEFVKDILHDFNTPIASMVINLKLLKKKIGENRKIERIENNIETLMRLQNNLQVFLKGIETQRERFEVTELLRERIAYFQVLYPSVNYSLDIPILFLDTNKDAFIRIMDNILSNAGKYNRAQGKVNVTLQETRLAIKDTGIGIEYPQKVFGRYYKEKERGIGIGLHIVKKLCDTLDIIIILESKVGSGTQVLLDLRKVIVK